MAELHFKTTDAKGNPPVPLTTNDEIVRLPMCPDCQGRGWFLIEPFRTGGTNGAGGISNMTQCLTCKEAHAYFSEHKKLPAALCDRIGPAADKWRESCP